MPLYAWDCPTCGHKHAEQQGMEEDHTMYCGYCGEIMSRDWGDVQFKTNRGFFSVTLGQDVKSQTDFEDKLTEWRYMQDLRELDGDNAPVKDEWVEKKMRSLRQSREESKAVDTMHQEQGFYDNVETLTVDGLTPEG